MTFRWLAKILPLAGAAVVLAQEPTIRVNVSLVHVIATVKTKAGELVASLEKDDFEVYDNGVKQEVARFGRQTEQPLSVALLVDTSGSTAKDLGYETTSAAKFLQALLAEGNPQDRVALFSFNYDIQQGGFTRNYAGLERQLKLLHGETGTSLYDAIYYASQALENREGRKAIVVMTDGGDTTSTRDLKIALKAAQMADAVIYAVVVLPITNNAGRNTGGEHALEFMAQGTGGRTYYPGVNAQLDRAFADIIRELRTQYVLEFYPRGAPLTKNPFHTLEVRTKSPDLRVSARNGYYGEAEGGGSGPSAPISVTPERTTKKRQEN
ncbi:MAG TPA: VWA domain-containing protein [Tepidisphaeraceae bacterium]|nr:VWA domain-containing protein [Tepidisphaeraceae bacterium]